MSIKLVKNSKAGDRWLRDGKFAKEEDIPEGEKKLYRNECMFCSSPADHKRMALGMMLGLCDTHYYSTTLGALVAQARKEGLNV